MRDLAGDAPSGHVGMHVSQSLYIKDVTADFLGVAMRAEGVSVAIKATALERSHFYMYVWRTPGTRASVFLQEKSFQTAAIAAAAVQVKM